MTIKTNRKEVVVFVTMLLLVVSNSRLLVAKGLDSFFEYGIYFLLMCEIWWLFFRKNISPKYKSKLFSFFVMVSVFFSVGIAVQNLDIAIKLRLIATMLVISSAAIIAEDYMDSFATIRAAAYGILCGTIVTTGMSILGGLSLFAKVYEGVFDVGFTGGVQFKNFYAAFILGSFMGIYFYNKFIQKKVIDYIVMAIEIVLLIASSARGTYILFLIFLIALNYKQLKNIKKKYRAIIILFLGLVVAIVGYIVYVEVALVSSNYLYRFRGVVNYFNYVAGDWFHIIFGNAEMAWSNPALDYVTNIRSYVGWDGSYEMGFINALIKNGLIGLLGFVLIYIRIIKINMKTQEWEYKVVCISVLCVLLISSLVESFVCNIHGIFGVYCYLLMAGVCGMIRQSGYGERR